MSHGGSTIASLFFESTSPKTTGGTRGELTEEQEAEIAQIFKLFDADRDGSVTKFELKEVLWSLGQHPDEEEIDSVCRQYDSSHTGVLDFGDFRKLMISRLTYQNTEEEFTKAFRAIDHNKDGSIDIGELKRLMVVMGFGLMDTELKEIFGLVDTDGKRKVDLDEFVDYMMNA